ncbi:unnamed protein product [Amoebophrya sp. A120]|nr:unnamed protein product [Amoebophrya sp. A120]|eukprot:GSA120T00019542001.1
MPRDAQQARVGGGGGSPGEAGSESGGSNASSRGSKGKSRLAAHGEKMRLLKHGSTDPIPPISYSEMCFFTLVLCVGFYVLSFVVEPQGHDCPRQIQQCLHLGKDETEEVTCEIPGGQHDQVTAATKCSNGAQNIMFHCMDKRYDLCGKRGKPLKWTWDDGIPLQKSLENKEKNEAGKKKDEKEGASSSGGGEKKGKTRTSEKKDEKEASSSGGGETKDNNEKSAPLGVLVKK